MPTGRHHPRLSPFSFPHDFKTSPRFRSERNHSTLKIYPRLSPFSLCTILKSPPVPTLKIHPRLSPFSFAHDFKISPCSPDSSHSASQLALFLIFKDEYYFRHFCAEKVALPPHPIHIWDARESNLPSRKWFFFSIYALMEQYRFRRLFQTNTRRQTSPPATATVTVHSQRQTESPKFPKKVAQCSLHTLS